jgi:hypothetical protein
MWIALLIMIGTMGAVVYGRQAGSPADTATAAQPS